MGREECELPYSSEHSRFCADDNELLDVINVLFP
jgi:hypothetical protein